MFVKMQIFAKFEVIPMNFDDILQQRERCFLIADFSLLIVTNLIADFFNAAKATYESRAIFSSESSRALSMWRHLAKLSIVSNDMLAIETFNWTHSF